MSLMQHLIFIHIYIYIYIYSWALNTAQSPQSPPRSAPQTPKHPVLGWDLIQGGKDGDRSEEAPSIIVKDAPHTISPLESKEGRSPSSTSILTPHRPLSVPLRSLSHVRSGPLITPDNQGTDLEPVHASTASCKVRCAV